MRPNQMTVDRKARSASIYLYGDIADWAWGDGEPNSADALVKELADLGEAVDSVDVHINSYGGDVAEGVAIYNALKGCGKAVTTVCDGFACSIASLVFMAGSERVMRESSLLMVHNPWTRATGNAEELRRAADDLDKMAQLSKTAYLAAGSMGAEELDRMMDEETWISPAEAVGLGLATAVSDDPASAAPSQSVRRSVFEALVGARPRQAPQGPEAAPEPPAPEEGAGLEAPQEDSGPGRAEEAEEAPDSPEAPEGPGPTLMEKAARALRALAEED